jgi:hypothetical protein
MREHAIANRRFTQLEKIIDHRKRLKLQHHLPESHQKLPPFANFV